MKYTLVAALLATASAQSYGTSNPDSAGGECETSADCTGGNFCIFSGYPNRYPAIWNPSYCGFESECKPEDTSSYGEDYKQFCLEFVEKPPAEESAFKLFSAGAAAVAAVAMTL